MRAARIAVVVVSVAGAIVATWLAWLSRDVPTPAGQSLGAKVVDITFPLAVLTLVAVGQLIASRHPRHLVAWSFLGLGLGGEILLAAQNYAVYGVVTAPGSLPGAAFVLWLSSWIWAIPSGALILVLLVFPDGRPVSRRWWIVAWIALAATVVQVVADALGTPYTFDVPLDSPIGTPLPLESVLLIATVGNVLWSAAAFAAVASLVVRFRRARGDERQQIKWFAYGGGIFAFSAALASFTYRVPTLGPIVSSATVVTLLLLPISAAIAIRRYRLYDIDVVIERTLVYGTTTAGIAIGFFAGIVVLQALLRPITGGSELAVAASTLASVALFQPVRRRTQSVVDRRFYRSRYDAARTLEDFSIRLRDEVDLDAVQSDLLRTVDDTLQPAHAGVWLRASRNDSRTVGG